MILGLTGFYLFQGYSKTFGGQSILPPIDNF